MSDSDKQALINGSATVQTEIVVHNENLFDINSTNTTSNCNVSITNNIMTITQSGSYPYVEYSIPNLTNGKTYTISFDYTKPADGQISVRIYDNTTMTYNVPNFSTPTNGNKFLTFTANENTKIRLYGRVTSGTNTDNVTYSNIRLEEGTPVSLTETNSVIDWNHEDFRLVKEEGWIGQFVARQVTGNLKDLSDDFSITDKELELKLGVRTNDNTNWYSLGNFLVTKATNDEVNDKTNFEALDYTKKFNKAYIDRITYPCTAGDLAQDVCDQCSVELGSTTFKNSDYVIQGNAFTNNESCRDVMKAIGKLAFSWVRVDWDNKVYIDFDPLPFKNQFDKDNANVLNATINTSNRTITAGSSNRTIYIPCKPNTTYTLHKKSSPNNRVIGYSSTLPTNGTVLSYISTIGANTTTKTITTGNDAQYLVVWVWNSGQDSETTFDEMLDSIIIKQQPSQYETFGNNKYYNLKTQKEVFGPVDKVVIGYSAIEGEKTYIGEENGTCVINVLDNPLVFNQEQRASIIESARDLLGFTYTPLNTLTVGHPWVKGNEIVRVSDMESVSHDTIPFDRTIQYFGHIKTLINSTTETKTNDNLAYKPEMVKNYERSEISNDQINKQIGIIIAQQTNTTNQLNETIATLDGTIQRVSKTETNINDITTTTQFSTGKNSLYLEDAMEGNALNYTVDGATEQDSYSGKNLFNVTDYTNLTLTNNGSATNTKTSSEITITTSANSSNSGVYIPIANLPSYINSYDDTVDYYVSFDVLASQSLDLRIGSTTKDVISIGTTKTRVSIQTKLASSFAIYSTSQRTGDTIKISNIMVSTNSDTTYEKYVGGTPSPNPDFPQQVKTIPSIMNLFDKENISWYRNNNSAFESTVNTSTNRIRTNSFAIKGGKTYTISGIPNGISVLLVSEYETSGGTRTTYTNTTTFTLDENINYVNFIFGGSNFTDETNELMKNANIMLEEGSVAHEYVPYGYWSKVKVTGKNLFDDALEIGTISNTGINNNSTANSRNVGYINVKSNTTYTISSSIECSIALRYYDRNKVFLSSGTTNASPNTFTAPDNTGYVRFVFVNMTNLEADIQIEENTEATNYEPYKENQVLIDMNKENLFDSNNYNTFDGYLNGSNVITSGGIQTGIYIPCQPNTTYTIVKENTGTNNRFCVFTTDAIPEIGVTALNYIGTRSGADNNAYYTITTPSTTQYLCVFMRVASTTPTLDEILSSIKIYESNNPTPYYELCKIGDYKDTLSIDSSGNCVINKNVGKVVLNGSENITYNASGNWNFRYTPSPAIILDTSSNKDHVISNYFESKNAGSDLAVTSYQNMICFRYDLYKTGSSSDFKTWLNTHNTNVYYVLATPETINLPNTKIPLFEGINHVTFVDDLETSTSVTYYRNTPLSGTYATVTQLNEVSTEKTQEIQTIRKEVLTEITNESLRIDIIRQEIDETGVPILNTGTGYTFDLDGLKMEKTNQDVKSQLDNDGLSVKYKDEDVLTARSNGVNAVNMTVNKFYIQRPIRMEKTRSITDSNKVGLGFFYVGE